MISKVSSEPTPSLISRRSPIPAISKFSFPKTSALKKSTSSTPCPPVNRWRSGAAEGVGVAARVDRLPVAGPCAWRWHVTILTKALPAGLLPQSGASLGVSEAMTGQWISVYALGSLLAAIPFTTATRSRRRRPLLMGAIVGFAIANLMTAVTIRPAHLSATSPVGD